jgi:hypothetical protein
MPHNACGMGDTLVPWCVLQLHVLLCCAVQAPFTSTHTLKFKTLQVMQMGWDCVQLLLAFCAGERVYDHSTVYMLVTRWHAAASRVLI